jgi:hypothetical protein
MPDHTAVVAMKTAIANYEDEDGSLRDLVSSIVHAAYELGRADIKSSRLMISGLKKGAGLVLVAATADDDNAYFEADEALERSLDETLRAVTLGAKDLDEHKPPADSNKDWLTKPWPDDETNRPSDLHFPTIPGRAVKALSRTEEITCWEDVVKLPHKNAQKIEGLGSTTISKVAYALDKCGVKWPRNGA